MVGWNFSLHVVNFWCKNWFSKTLGESSNQNKISQPIMTNGALWKSLSSWLSLGRLLEPSTSRCWTSIGLMALDAPTTLQLKNEREERWRGPKKNCITYLQSDVIAIIAKRNFQLMTTKVEGFYLPFSTPVRLFGSKISQLVDVSHQQVAWSIYCSKSFYQS